MGINTGRMIRIAQALSVWLLAVLAVALAAPASADCDAGCFPLGPGSAEYNRCMASCQSVAPSRAPGGLPTITNPQGVRAVNIGDNHRH